MNHNHGYNQDLGEISRYLPHKDLVESLHVHRGYSRNEFPAGEKGLKEGFHIDALIIDDRRGFYQLRHSITTLYHRREAIGFCDMTSPFLYPDYRISCFGRNSQVLHSTLHRRHDDTQGVPQRELRLGHPNYGQEGYFVEATYANLPVTQALAVLNKQILDYYHERNKQLKRKNIS